MQYTIEKISQPRTINTRYGPKTSYGVKFKECNNWANGFVNYAFNTWQEGDVVEVEIKENNGYLNFNAVGYGSHTPQGQAPQQKQQEQKEEKPNWDKISYGKCKHAYLLEAFKLGMNLEEAEPMAEKWADASMRKRGEAQMKDYGDGEQADQVPFNDNFQPF